MIAPFQGLSAGLQGVPVFALVATAYKIVDGGPLFFIAGCDRRDQECVLVYNM
jgi:hypothetical protein